MSERLRVDELMRRNVLDVNDGYRAKNVELSVAGLPFARAGNIGDGFRFEDVDCFPECDLERVGKKVSRPGDVVFTSKGTVGRFAYVRRETPRFVYSPQLCFWRSLQPDVLDARYLYYWMRSAEFVDQAAAVKGQTDMADYVSLRDQRRFFVPIPPIDEQRAIARVLTPLDARIDLHRDISQTVELAARAAFERVCGPYFDDDDCIVRCQDLIDRGALLIGDGYRAKRVELSETGLPFARAANINNGFRFTGVELLGEEGVARAKHKVSRSRDVAFTSKGTVGRFAFVTESTRRFVYSPQLCFWRSLDTERLRPSYLLYWMRSRSFLEQVNAVKGQTDMADYVSLRDQKRMFVVVPPQDVQARAAAILLPLQDYLAALVSISKTLSDLRDALLPRLLSGEVRVEQAEELIQETV